MLLFCSFETAMTFNKVLSNLSNFIALLVPPTTRAMVIREESFDDESPPKTLALVHLLTPKRIIHAQKAFR